MPMSWEFGRDAALLAQMADGDITALGVVLDAYGGVLLALVQQVIGPSSEAEELIHDIFLQLWRQAPRWGNTPPHPLRTWLVLEARRQALVLLQDGPELGAYGEDPQLLSRSWRPKRRYDAAAIDDPSLGRLRAKVRRALGHLRPGTRALISLSFLRGLGPNALGKKTQQSTRRAHQKLLGAVHVVREAIHTQLAEH